MALEWRDSFVTGIQEIDDQHKELFQIINKLFDACSQGKGKDEVKNVIDFLSDYVVRHFATEESLQQQYNYPEYDAHKKLHEDFINEFSDIKKEFEAQGATPMFVMQVNRRVVDWLIMHIGRVDKELGKFLKDKM